MRLDAALTGLHPELSREKAKALIMAGQVYVDGQKADKAGLFVKEGQKVELRGEPLRYVSRGGLKLEKAMQQFPICLTDRVCMDIGASTGGFTDCMLQNGASRVYAIDVGYGQLAWKLRSDSRVVNLERKNIRYLTQADMPEQADFASIDVSFISLKLVLPVAHRFLKPDGSLVALIKPQFEAGRENVGKKGVVRDKAVHLSVILDVLHFAQEAGFFPAGLTFSPVKGPEGNIEYLLYLKKQVDDTIVDGETARQVVERSHNRLNGGQA